MTQKLSLDIRYLPYLLLVITPAVAFLSPRFLAFIPGLIGIAGLAAHCLQHTGLKAFFMPEKHPSFLRIYLAVAGLFFLFIAISLTYSPYFYESLEQTGKVSALLITSALCMLAMTHMRSDRHAMQASVEYASYVLIAALIILCADYTFDLPLHEWMKRNLSQNDGFNPTDVNRNMIAALFFGLPIAGYCLMSKYMWRFIMICALLTYAAFFTESQSYILGLSVALAGLLIIQTPPRYIIPLTATAVAILVLTMPFLAYYGFSHATTWPVMHYLQDAYPKLRLEIWYGATRLIGESPWLGYSINTFRLQELPVEQRYLSKTQWLHPHNAVLQIWYNFGLPGAIALVAALVSIYRAIHRIGDVGLQKLGYVLINSAFAVACVSYGIWQGWWLGTLILSLCLFIAVGASQNVRTQ